MKSLVVVFVAGVLLFYVILSPAAASVSYETITAPRVRNDGIRELGSVAVRIQPLLETGKRKLSPFWSVMRE